MHLRNSSPAVSITILFICHISVDENQFAKAAKLGVTKVNIDTDGRLVWCRVHREMFRDQPEVFDLRKPGTVFMAEYAKFIAHKNVKLGSAGQLDAVREILTK